MKVGSTSTLVSGRGGRMLVDLMPGVGSKLPELVCGSGSQWVVFWVTLVDVSAMKVVSESTGA